MMHVDLGRPLSIHLNLFECLLEWQLLVRRLTGKTRFTLSESQALAEIATGSAVTAKQIATSCGLEKSTVSRLLAGLKKQGLISTKDASDRRSNCLNITKKGVGALAADSRHRSSVSKKLLDALPPQKRLQLVGFFRALGDGFQIPRLPQQKDENPLRSEQKRLSRAFGLLKDRFLKSDFTLLEVHLIMQVQKSPYFLTARQLEENLPYSLSRITRAFQALETRGVIERIPNPTDRRHLHLCLTNSGKSLAQKLLKLSSKEVAQACANISEAELKNGLSLLEKIIFAFNKPGIAVVVRSLPAGASRYAARAFIVEQLLAQGLHEKLSGEILSDSQHAFVLEFDSRIVAVLGAASNGKKFAITNLVWETEQVTSAGVEQLIATTTKELGYQDAKISVGRFC